MAHDVFLSYAAADQATAFAVVAGLEGHGIRCWVAHATYRRSEYGEEIVEAVKACRILVLIFSAQANNSPTYVGKSNAPSPPEEPLSPSGSKT